MLKVRRKTNYVIACWDGNRRSSGNAYFKNRSFLIASHIFALKEYKHKLDQITIVVPFNERPSDKFEEFLSKLPASIQNAKVVIVRRGNYGLSYGSYAHVFALYKRQFDYFIFNEDDYVYVKDHFDSELIRRFNQSYAGIITSLHWRSQHGHKQPTTYYLESIPGSVVRKLDPRHGGDRLISNGITSNYVLEKVMAETRIYNNYFHRTKSGYGDDIDQLMFEDQFTRWGPTEDLANDYCIPFNGATLNEKPIKYFRNTTENYFVVPVEHVPSLLRKNDRHAKLVEFVKGF